MITFSCCMIVKNEEKVLARCLDSICDLMDEIIIVDTGSTDNTKQIAAKYTDKIYDLAWADDFSEARNYSFSKATMDYIYCPDADEYLDEENHRQLALLKQFMDYEIEIVQMMYNTISDDTVLNIKKEYRPKLFKRLRTFTWVDPVHETIRLDPVVFDSDIVITHAPTSNHAKRDFDIFKKAIEIDGNLSEKVISMYATELIKQGTEKDFLDALAYFTNIFENTGNTLLKLQAKCILVRFARISKNSEVMNALVIHSDAPVTSELAYDAGLFCMADNNYPGAIEWLNTAINEASYCLDIHTQGDLALSAMIQCLKKTNADSKIIKEYNKRLLNWHVPVEDTI